MSGKKTRIISRLRREMRTASKNQEFERAAQLRNQIMGLENVFSHRHTLESEPKRHASGARDWRKIQKEIQSILNTKKQVSRVEGYDISNISGTAATGSMVVFIDGNPAKSEYKKFRIKTIAGANDVAMHAEMMRRRLAHQEWGIPDLLLIDGGLPQINAVRRVLRIENTYSSTILTALAKREEELYGEGKMQPVRLDTLSRDTMLFFQHVRDESHRFAKKYHHQLREMLFSIAQP